MNRSELEVLNNLRGTYGPSGRDRIGRWVFAFFFLGLCAPVCWLMAASQIPPQPGHLPTALAIWMLMPLSIAIGLYALCIGHPSYLFDGEQVTCQRGKKTLWQVPLAEITRVERHDEKASDQSLLLAAADGREWRLNLYPQLRQDWRALKKSAG